MHFNTLVVVIVVSLSVTTGQMSWEEFKTKYDKNYTGTDETSRRENFLTNVKYIEQTHREGYQMDITQFADMSEDDMKRENYVDDEEGAKELHLITVRPYKVSQGDTLNWTMETPALESGTPSPLAPLASLVMEAQFNKTAKKVGAFSSQQLTECAYPDKSTKPLRADDTFEYIFKNGLEKRDDYPFSEQKGKCKFDDRKVVVTIKKYSTLAIGEDVLLQTVKDEGPVLAAMNAQAMDLRFYKSGIYDGPCSNGSFTTWVVVFGYGSDNGKAYWTVRPNWGTSFGEKGFIRVARNHLYHCGLGAYAVFPEGLQEHSRAGHLSSPHFYLFSLIVPLFTFFSRCL